MATIEDHLELEKKHFENFKDLIPKFQDLCDATIDHLMNLGIIQISTAFEHAVAQTGSLKVVSTVGSDFCDSSDAKLSSVRTCSRGRTYSAPIKCVHNKVGILRVQVYERKQDNFYYFKIPYDAYSHISRTSNIEIGFHLDGTPRKTNKWWQYEVESFEEMSL